MDHSMFATNCLSYHFAGDYQIPDISIADSESLGVWGRMRKQYLNGHRPLLFAELLLSEKLYSHCFEIEYLVALQLFRKIKTFSQRKRKPHPSLSAGKQHAIITAQLPIYMIYAVFLNTNAAAEGHGIM